MSSFAVFGPGKATELLRVPEQNDFFVEQELPVERRTISALPANTFIFRDVAFLPDPENAAKKAFRVAQTYLVALEVPAARGRNLPASAYPREYGDFSEIQIRLLESMDFNVEYVRKIGLKPIF